MAKFLSRYFRLPVAALYAEDYRGADVLYIRTFNFTVHVYEFLSDEFGNRKGENK